MKKLLLALALFTPIALKADVEAKIIGGKVVTDHKYSFMTALLFKDGDLWEDQMCGASIIDEDTILTAAHCVESMDADELEVAVGRISLDSEKEGGQRIYVKEIIIHQDYDNMSFENDIALLKLEEDVVFNENVAPIEFRKASLNNRRVTVIGWGNISQDSREFPKDLMEVDVVVINRFLCNLPGWLNGQVKPSMFCAGNSFGGQDSCQGDSGGPIFSKEKDGSFHQKGIVSWGEGCAEAMKPGVYTRLENYTNWIEQRL